MADLYVYFNELGVRMLKPGGLLCFIVTNKWTKAGYGDPLRRFFSEKA
jgi:type II restriction/modification system DNA methylase subunit YeeA